MEVFEQLEENSEKNANYLLVNNNLEKSNNIDEDNSDINNNIDNNNDIENNDDNENDNDDDNENDDYLAHHSKILSQQFGIQNDDDIDTSTNNHSNNNKSRDLTSVVQKMKLKLLQREEKKKAQDNQDNIILTKETSTQIQIQDQSTQIVVTQDFNDENNFQTQPIKSTPIGKFDEISTNIIQTNGNDNLENDNLENDEISTNVIQTNQNDEDDDDDDDEIIKVKPRTLKITDEDTNREKEDNNYDDDDDDDDEDDIIKPTQRRNRIVDEDTANNEKNAISTSNMTSLFVHDEDGDEDGDNIEDQVNAFHKMTKEHDFLSRKVSAANKHNTDDDYLLNKSKMTLNRKEIIEEKRIKREELAKQFLQNELLKKAAAKIEKINPTTYSKQKLLSSLKADASNSDNDDSDNEINNNTKIEIVKRENTDSDNTQFSNLDSQEINSPSTSPLVENHKKKITIKSVLKSWKTSSTHNSESKLVESKNEKIDDESTKTHINLDDSSDDEDDDMDVTMIKKTKTLDIKLILSRRQKNKIEKVQKETLADKIKKLNAKQLKMKYMKSLNDHQYNLKSNKENGDLTDEMLAKMLYEEQIKNSKRLKQQSKLEKQKELLRKGKFPSHDDESEDDPEFSEYSSEFDMSDDEVQVENEDPEGKNEDKEEVATEDNKKESEPVISTQNIQDDTSFKLTQNDALKDFNFSFGELADQDPTQKSQSHLTTQEKFKRLKNISMTELQDENSSNSISIDNESRISNDTSFLTKQLNNADANENQIQKSTSNDNESNKINFKELLDSQNLILETQIDQPLELTQSVSQSLNTQNDNNLFDSSTQNLERTETIEIEKTDTVDNIMDTKKGEEKAGDEKEEDDDDDDDEKIKIPRKVRLDNDSDDNDSEVEETEEDRQKVAELIKLAKKKERELAKQREREFKSKGLGDIMENEAVESDDEYHGVGGADRDLSDEENSEDEKLIDDASNIQTDEHEIRRYQLENELKEDQEKVSRTFKDIKTHNLTKRRAKDGVYAVDLSDDEDGEENEELLRWRELIRRRKIKERKEFMANNKYNISENDPKKPFFDTMAVNLPSHISIYKDSLSLTELDEDNSDHEAKDVNDNDTITKRDFQDYYNNTNNEISSSSASLKRRKLNKVKSFNDDDDIRFSSFKDQEYERARYEVLSTDEEDDDDHDGSKQLKMLKKKTSVKLQRRNHLNRSTTSISEDVHDEFSVGLLSNKSNSITASFKKITEKKVKISANTGKIIRDVQVTTSSKSIANSKVAVSRLTSNESENNNLIKKPIKGSGIDRLDRMLAKGRKLGIKKLSKHH